MRIKQQFILIAILAAYLPFAHAQEANLTNKIEEAKVLLNQIQNEARQNNQNRVYLGTAQVDAYGPIDLVDSYTRQLIALLNTLQTSPAKPTATNLQWLPHASPINATKETFFNAGRSGENINICRAPFIGTNVQSRGIYPGQLTATGCHISYAGYAFIMTKFDVLTGKNDKIQWIPIADVKKSMNATATKSTINTKPIQDSSVSPKSYAESRFPMPFFVLPYQPFNFNITINGALPVAGGYEGGFPVLICRANQNNVSTIGKLVFFVGNNGKKQESCDISVDDKEVVIQDNYELLFWQQDTNKQLTKPNAPASGS